MADFVQKADVKRSVRALTTPIADVATLNTLVQGVIDTNAFQCVDHVVAGVTHPAVSRGTQSFGIRVVYENPSTLKNMGIATARASTVAGYTAAAAAIVGNAALATAIGGTAIQDTEGEGYSISLNCHDANGEDYTVTFTRKTITVSSYEDNAIVGLVNTWANTKPALA
jgi:ABC-type uncharacterized transport system permease subunit